MLAMLLAPRADVARRPAKPYTEAAIASSQTPVTFFLPKRPIILVDGLVCRIGTDSVDPSSSIVTSTSSRPNHSESASLRSTY